MCCQNVFRAMCKSDGLKLIYIVRLFSEKLQNAGHNTDIPTATVCILPRGVLTGLCV